ncbi:PQQ-binding-like beta-propeller repeat protein [Breznakiella homolactica]|uniref:PQQ-binding-like beta-propeller repeat protein n=1 Tax=Breznakiella homolactica TaxID=2798577 RepID=A0A7T8BA65_9SPIR|nr:PQQ-binding-like beta-propeller repeat protein [Breznakiella homolactica]QQO09036.1 PQQ-binding-like beta-propeller repeat protein [Breznakiella homolactica]
MKMKFAAVLGAVIVVCALCSCDAIRSRFFRNEPGEAAPPAAEESVPVPIISELETTVRLVQGNAELVRSNERIPLENGAALFAGDTVITGDLASLEITFSSMANIRLLPDSELEIGVVRSIAGEEETVREAELRLSRGALLAKVEKLSLGDEFLVGTPNAVSRVRGTRFLLTYEGAAAAPADRDRGAMTTLAVDQGNVALLPGSGRLQTLFSQRDSDPVSAAVLDRAFSMAPGAGTGEELRIGGGIGNARIAADRESLAAADAAYDTLFREASNAGGIPPDTFETRTLIEAALQRYKAVPLGDAAGELLGLMGYLNDPGGEVSKIPAALPGEFFPSYRERRVYPRQEKKQEPPPNPYPAVVWDAKISDTALSDSISRVGTILLAMDSDGRVYGVDDLGNVLWTYGENSAAMTGLDTSVAVTGETDLTILDGSTGTPRGQWNFDSWAALPRSKAVPVPDGVAMATPRGVAICRQENAQMLREIPVAGGIVSPLVLAGRELVGINGAGSVVIMDVAAGSIRLEVPSRLGTDVLSPRYMDGTIYASNRSGLIIAVDIDSGRILWERTIPQGIRIEPELDASRLYLWASDKTLIRIVSADGSDAGLPVSGVESAPLLSQGRLYWGSAGGTLVTADPATGRILKSNAVPGASSVRPLMVGGNLYIGTDNGRMIKMGAEYL